MFDEEDRDLNLILPLVLGIAVVISIGTVLFASLGLNGKGAAGKSTVRPAISTPAVAAPVAAVTPPPAPAAAITGLPAKVFFTVGASAIDDEGKKSIAVAAAALAAMPNAKVGLSGFVDASGNKDQNAELAKQRAFAVRDALQAAGVAEDRMALRKPEEITAGSVDSREARRVEINVAQ